MKVVSVKQLLDRYDGFLLDAYGVLVDASSTLPGAEEFLQELRHRGKAFRIVSNDGSTTPEAKAERWAGRGLTVEPERYLTPWHVLASDLSPVEVASRSGYVIGTKLSEEMHHRAGGRACSEGELPDAIFLADELTEPLLARCDRALSLCVRRYEKQGALPDLVLVNPDLVYPTGEGYGFTAGAIALMFEAALERLLGRPCRFHQVGKPGPELFQLGLRELGLDPRRVVMLGDQWATDILGAQEVGLDSVLLTTGLGTPDPNYPNQMILHGLCHGATDF